MRSHNVVEADPSPLRYLIIMSEETSQVRGRPCQIAIGCGNVKSWRTKQKLGSVMPAFRPYYQPQSGVGTLENGYDHLTFEELVMKGGWWSGVL